MVSQQAAVEWKRGENPFNISALIQVQKDTFSPGKSRFKGQWHAGLPVAADSNLLPTAFYLGSWDIGTMVSERGSLDCPDQFDTVAADGEDVNGHLSMIANIVQMLSQGHNVAIQGTSAGSPTYIRYGRLVSPLINPPLPQFRFRHQPICRVLCRRGPHRLIKV